MGLLEKSDLIKRYNAKQSTLLDEEEEIRYSKGKLIECREDFSYYKTYDIFFSHSYDDARIVKLIKEMLEEKGYDIYVDWIEDRHLDRGKVTEDTAEILRGRMDRCSSLIYLTSQSAEQSLWMPWELGYMDAKTKRVVVAPILDGDEDFEGREYLGLYPYIDLTSDSFYVHSASNKWVGFSGWMSGENPQRH